jgi:serine/threonine protein kinase
LDIAVDAAPKLSTLGKYSLIASLGQGGMAKVYLALMAGPAGFNKLLVVKALREDMLGASEEFVQMFLDEARLSARLNHPNIVQTYEVGESEGRYFIAMEYLEGQCLRAVQRKVDPMPLDEELRVLADTARGLHYAHELKGFDGEPLGVVHRDVSPQNIFLTYDGQVKLLDFGIAKTQDAEHLTKVGVIKGKIDYIAPEQIRGEKIDRRADVFALGAMMWEAVTGKRFAGGPKVADVTKIHTRVTGNEPKVRELKPELPEELAVIIDKAIALDPDDRYATACAFADDVDTFLEKQTRKVNSKTLAELMAPPFDDERSKMRKLVDQQIQLAQRRGGVQLGETTGGLPRLGSRTLPSTEVDLSESGFVDLTAESVSSPPSTGPSGAYVKANLSSAQVDPQAPPPARGGPSRNMVLVVAAVTVLGAAFLALRPEPETAVQAATPVPAVVEAPAPAMPAPVVTPEPAPAAETVSIRIEVVPADAVVTLDGSQLPKLPFTAEMRKDGIGHHIVASAPGYESRKVMLPFDRDRHIKIELDERQVVHPRRRASPHTPAAEPAAQAAPSPPKPAARSDDEVAPGADLVPKRARPRPEIDTDDPYAN